MEQLEQVLEENLLYYDKNVISLIIEYKENMEIGEKLKEKYDKVMEELKSNMIEYKKENDEYLFSSYVKYDSRMSNYYIDDEGYLICWHIVFSQWGTKERYVEFDERQVKKENIRDEYVIFSL